MNSKAQTQVEAIICLTVFLAILGQAVSTMGQIKEMAEEGNDAASAKGTAQACCMLADTVYATNATATEASCEAKDGEMTATKGSKNKKCKPLSEKIRMVQTGEKTIMEVSTNEHYK